jgi:hypothetical protein
MPTAPVRRVHIQAALRDAEVAAYGQLTLDEVLPALPRVPGMRAVEMDAGAGGLRAALRSVFEMEDAGVYERLLAEAPWRPLIATTSAAWDMATASQTGVRAVTSELIRALSSTR